MRTPGRLIGGLLALAVAAGCSSSGPAAAPPTPAASSSPAVPTAAPVTTTPRATISAPPTPRPTPSRTTVPPLSAAARADGLVDIRSVVPDAIVDLRYATSNNFTGVRLYPKDARCLVHASMAPGLRTAAAQLRRSGLVLVFWDCYRPHAVQVRMFQVVPNPAWVARPGPTADSHEAARSVDVSLARAGLSRSCPAGSVQGHCLLDMGTGFDDFTPRAYAFATDGVSATALANRATLRRAMNAGGIVVYSGEWWHFDGPDALVQRPYLAAAVN